ncbi:MAG: 6-phosphofructokinase [Flavobacteriales bacterium]|nr:6-phosphofructokinase [Flavobacteriales bacterium]
MKRIGVFTSGGDSPGMNACIRAVVRTALYHDLEVMGVRRGYQGMIEDEFVEMSRKSVANILQLGGTILKTARSKEFMTPEGRKKAFENLKNHEIDALVCIGGNGSYTGALKLYEEYNIPTVGLPGTIDNDLYGTDYTIGYDTAVNTAVEAIDKIRDTADSHNRVFLVEVMGRDSGFIGIQVGISAGAEAIFIPERTGEMEMVRQHFNNANRRNKSFSIIVVAEGETTGNSSVLFEKIKKEFPDIDIRNTVLGHIQRGGSPTAKDRVLASRLGYEGVLALLNGEKNVTVGVVNDQVKYTPFTEAISHQKKIDTSLIKMAEILSY